MVVSDYYYLPLATACFDGECVKPVEANISKIEEAWRIWPRHIVSLECNECMSVECNKLTLLTVNQSMMRSQLQTLCIKQYESCVNMASPERSTYLNMSDDTSKCQQQRLHAQLDIIVGIASWHPKLLKSAWARVPASQPFLCPAFPPLNNRFDCLFSTEVKPSHTQIFFIMLPRNTLPTGQNSDVKTRAFRLNYRSAGDGDLGAMSTTGGMGYLISRATQTAQLFLPPVHHRFSLVNG